ncbi:aldolase [Candidatus Dependentiae bacterium]|nr:aldolase [Candidatus Dependentiae bacterium]
MSPTLKIPASVPRSKRDVYVKNYNRMTGGTGQLFLFAGDQKIEHLHKDFFGAGISNESADPEHFFKIASQSRIGCFASQLGLIARYAQDYSGIPYLIKMNAKTDLVHVNQKDPLSLQLVSFDDVIRVRDEYGLSIVGVGYTIYLGSEYEAEMLREAAQLVMKAHSEGMAVVLWIYPRGKAVSNERSVEVIAGSAGVAHCLGADFVKVNPPAANNSQESAVLLRQVVVAAGNTGVVCSGGASRDMKEFLSELESQLITGRTAGAAIGRNIHQKSIEQAVAFCGAIAAMIYDGASADEAFKSLG